MSYQENQEQENTVVKQGARTAKLYKVRGIWNKDEDFINGFGSEQKFFSFDNWVDHTELKDTFRPMLSKILSTGSDVYLQFENKIIFGIALVGKVLQTVTVEINKFEDGQELITALFNYAHYNPPMENDFRTIDHFINVVQHNSNLINNARTPKASDSEPSPGEEHLRALGLSFHKNEKTQDSVLLNCDVKEVTPMLLALLLNFVSRIDGLVAGGVEYIFIRTDKKEYHDRINFNTVINEDVPDADSDEPGYAVVVKRTMSTGNNLCMSQWFEESDFTEAAKSLIDKITF